MSKVKIEGNASGTGTLTISAPNTNTDRTLTLPDGAGELLTDATGLTSSSALNATNLTSGTIPDARFPSALPAIDGSALTGISAGEITSSSYAATGYVVMNDGLVIQWGNLGNPTRGTIQYFATTFPTLCAAVMVTYNGAHVTNFNAAVVGSVTASYFYYNGSYSGAYNPRYIAIGY